MCVNIFTDPYHHHHQYMSSTANNNKIPPSPSSSINNNNHFHYHLYQYQTSNCCFNLLDHRKSSSSTVTTSASNENYSTYHATQSAIANSCPLGVTDVSLSLNTQHSSSQSGVGKDDDLNGSRKKSLDENTTRLNTSESTNFFNNISRNLQQQQQNTPSSFDEHSRTQTAEEKIIAIELTNETFHKKPQPNDDEQDDCSCTKKYLPYKVNERNVWQVYETSDCKYIQSKTEIDEIFQPPPSSTTQYSHAPDTGDSTMTIENSLLHSRSNFSNEIICHAINHQANHRRENNAPHKNGTASVIDVNTQQASNNNNNTNNNDSVGSSSLYTPTFNIKPINLDSSSCHCNEDEEIDANKEKCDKSDEKFSKNVLKNEVK